MAVTRHTVTTASHAASTGCSWTHAVHADSNWLMIEVNTPTIGTGVTSALTVDGVTVEPQWTLRGTANYSTTRVYGVAVTGGTTVTIAVTFSSAVASIHGSTCLEGVDTADPYGAETTATGTSVAFSPTALSNSGSPNFVFDVAGYYRSTSGGR